MREILFRGKDVKSNNIWRKGSFVLEADPKHGDGYCICWAVDMGGEYPIMRRARVLPETVSQYIGFVDRYRDKIFEGDILKYVIPDPPHADSVGYAEVIWDNGWKLQFKGHEPEETDQEDLSKYTEIVGNIWDTPELLGVKR